MIAILSGGLLALFLSFACFSYSLRMRVHPSGGAILRSLCSTSAWLLLVLGLAMLKVALIACID